MDKSWVEYRIQESLKAIPTGYKHLLYDYFIANRIWYFINGHKNHLGHYSYSIY